MTDFENIANIVGLLIQRVSLIEQVNNDIMRTQIKEQEMIIGLSSSVQALKVQVNTISIRQTSQGGSGAEGVFRSSIR